MDSLTLWTRKRGGGEEGRGQTMAERGAGPGGRNGGAHLSLSLAKGEMMATTVMTPAWDMIFATSPILRMFSSLHAGVKPRS